MLNRLRIQLRDRLRYSRWPQTGLGLSLMLRAGCAGAVPARLNLLARAYRQLLAAGNPQWVEEQLRGYVEDAGQAAVWRENRIGWEEFGRRTDERTITKGLILKAPVSADEKGVLFISFEYNLIPLFTANEWARLFQEYTVICATSWSPTHFQALWTAAHIPGSDVFFTMSNQADLAWFLRLKSGTNVLPLFISSWVNPDFY